MTVSTPILDAIHSPADLRRLDEKQLRQVAEELRAETINAAVAIAMSADSGSASNENKIRHRWRECAWLATAVSS